MNILVLETDPRELAIIQQVLSVKKNAVMTVSNSAQAWKAIQEGNFRFLIINQDTTDAKLTDLISLVRSRPAPDSIYVLSIGSAIPEGESFQGADDTLHRPYKTADLINRVAIAERIISLTSNLKSARDQLESQAAFDSLTSFLNRAAFLRQAAGELERSRRASQPMSLIALDIDNFKEINGKFGVIAGDNVLKAVSRTVREKSRPYDCIGRWTGDEFVLALPSVIGADAEKIAERIIAGVRGTRIEVPNEPPLNVKISAGVASIMRITSSTEIEPIIQQARQAVTRSKEAGGNQVFIIFL